MTTEHAVHSLPGPAGSKRPRDRARPPTAPSRLRCSPPRPAAAVLGTAPVQAGHAGRGRGRSGSRVNGMHQRAPRRGSSSRNPRRSCRWGPCPGLAARSGGTSCWPAGPRIDHARLISRQGRPGAPRQPAHVALGRSWPRWPAGRCSTAPGSSSRSPSPPAPGLRLAGRDPRPGPRLSRARDDPGPLTVIGHEQPATSSSPRPCRPCSATKMTDEMACALLSTAISEPWTCPRKPATAPRSRLSRTPSRSACPPATSWCSR